MLSIKGFRIHGVCTGLLTEKKVRGKSGERRKTERAIYIYIERDEEEKGSLTERNAERHI